MFNRKPTGLLPDWEIARLAQGGMIEPFVPEKIREVDHVAALSFGLGHYGYDLRLSLNEFKIFRHIPGSVVNPKNFNPKNLEIAELHSSTKYGAHWILPGLNYGLGVTLEKLRIPKDITVIFIGKSTYARTGLIANVTPGEAGWEGHLTLEFSNSSPADCMIFPEEGIVQALFFRAQPCHRPYGNGKYQNQAHQIVTARI